jgi:hypothetical protein
MKVRIHAAAGVVATLCILGFWSSTVIAELFLSPQVIVLVKRSILDAMWLLIPAMAVTGASGFALARGRAGRLLEQKKRRMPFIAANGLLVLLPAAIYLHAKAFAGEFDAAFYGVQTVELLVGAINLSLLGANLLDGLRLAGRLRAGPPHVAARR